MFYRVLNTPLLKSRENLLRLHYVSFIAIFEEVTQSFSHMVNKYDNNMIIGDFNINTNSGNGKCNHLSEFYDTFGLTVLVLNPQLSDCHEMILTFFKEYFSRLPPTTIFYRNCKYFNLQRFLNDSDQTCNIRKPMDEYSHTLLKSKKLRGNHAPFMSKKLSKATMDKYRLKNK